MMKRRRIAAAMLCALLPLLGAGKCEGDGNPGDPRQPEYNKEHQQPNPGPEVPAPAADPGPHNESGHARLQVIWVGERGGHVEYTLGGLPVKKVCPQPTKEADGKYHGDCIMDVSAVPGTTIGFTWFPAVGGMFAQCVIYAKNTVQDYQHVQGGSCAVSWKVS
jgi:hypothetical protein